MGGARGEQGWGVGERGDGGENPSGAGRGGPARPSPAAAERAGPALQKAAAGWPGRSHPAAGDQLRPPHRPLHRGRRPAARPRWQRPSLRVRPRGALGKAGGPAEPPPAATPPLPSLPAAQPSLPALAGPCQDGVGPAPVWRWAALWAPSSPPRPDRPRGPGRWVWADETARVGAGVGTGVMRRRERRGGGNGLWALRSLGEQLHPT